jgi:hypothetical protein
MRLICASALVALSPSVAMANPDAKAAFEMQIADWNRGDLEAALAAYLNAPEMTWVNRNGVEKGFAAFAASMRAEFERSGQMGTFSGEVLEARELARDLAMIVVKWSIERDGKRLMGGVSTQLWQRFDTGWKIVFEHAS